MSVEIKMSGYEANELFGLANVGKLAIRLVELRKDAKTSSARFDEGCASTNRAECAMAELEKAVNQLPVGVKREAMKNGKA